MTIKLGLTMGLALGLLAGCGGTFKTDYDPVSREQSQSWRVQSVRVVVPDSLTTTERNSLLPSADIIWHGDPVGNRREQVATLLENAISKGSKNLRGRQPVVLHVVLEEFHAVTPAAVARAPSAVHNIRYSIQVIDARTGKPITNPRKIAADLSANVGDVARRARRGGRTQKFRISNHIAAVTAGWLRVGPDKRAKFTSLGG